MTALIDGSNIVNICYHGFVRFMEKRMGKGYVPVENDLGTYIHFFFQKVREYYQGYREVVFCLEGHSSTAWRKSLYSQYKANRKKDDPQCELLGRAFEVSEELAGLLPGKVMKVDNCEGDDVIYALSRYLSLKKGKVRIVSSDRDLLQIANFFPDSASVFDPMESKMLEKDEHVLARKAICGDRSDGIKGLKGIGERTFERMLKDDFFWNEVMDRDDNRREYGIIMNVVDLRLFPYSKDAVKAFLAKEWNPLNKKGVLELFDRYHCEVCRDVFLGETVPQITGRELSASLVL